MTLYRVELRLTAPLGSPLVGPMLFGQICWLLRENDGDEHLRAWLEDPHRAWRISDGFPSGFLPRPMVRPRHLKPDELDTIKERKRLGFVSRIAWMEARTSWDEIYIPQEAFAAEPREMRRIAHNQVHRSGRGTLEEGGLYFLEEDWRFTGSEVTGSGLVTDPSRVDLYIETTDPADRVTANIAILGQQGFGRDASTGRGRWDILAVVEDNELVSGAGSRRMSLSRGVIDPKTMEDALWRLDTHFGRVGPQLSLTGVSPFKRPVLLTRPGMTFTPKASGPWGQMLEGLHADRTEIRMNARHIAIPFDEASGGDR